MSYTLPLKKLLTQRINEVICSIELRISLNTQQIELVNSPTTAPVELPSDQAQEVIAECTETINKLTFLRSYMDRLHLNQSLYFLDNYHKYSLQEFYTSLKTACKKQ